MYANQRVMGRILIKDAPFPPVSAQITQWRAQLLPGGRPLLGGRSVQCCCTESGAPVSLLIPTQQPCRMAQGPVPPAQPGCATATYSAPCTNRDAQVTNTAAQTYRPSDPIFTPVASRGTNLY